MCQEAARLLETIVKVWEKVLDLRRLKPGENEEGEPQL